MDTAGFVSYIQLVYTRSSNTGASGCGVWDADGGGSAGRWETDGGLVRDRRSVGYSGMAIVRERPGNDESTEVARFHLPAADRYKSD